MTLYRWLTDPLFSSALKAARGRGPKIISHKRSHVALLCDLKHRMAVTATGCFQNSTAIGWLSRKFGGVSEMLITMNFRLVQFRLVSASKHIAENLEPCGMRWRNQQVYRPLWQIAHL